MFSVSPDDDEAGHPRVGEVYTVIGILHTNQYTDKFERHLQFKECKTDLWYSSKFFTMTYAHYN